MNFIEQIFKAEKAKAKGPTAKDKVEEAIGNIDPPDSKSVAEQHKTEAVEHQKNFDKAVKANDSAGAEKHMSSRNDSLAKYHEAMTTYLADQYHKHAAKMSEEAKAKAAEEAGATTAKKSEEPEPKFDHVFKYNHNHGANGEFSSGGGGKGTASAMTSKPISRLDYYVKGTGMSLHHDGKKIGTVGELMATSEKGKFSARWEQPGSKGFRQFDNIKTPEKAKAAVAHYHDAYRAGKNIHEADAHLAKMMPNLHD